MEAGEDHRELVEVSLGRAGALLSSPAVRGFPGPAPGLRELLAALPPVSGRVGDVSGSAGGGALGALAAGGDVHVTVLEPSAAALRAARRSFADEPRVGIAPGLPWDLPAGASDVVLALPAGDRGNARVRAELEACARALDADGCAYLAMHKDLGARRYERVAGELFGEVRVLARSKGWRVIRLAGPRAAAPSTAGQPWGGFRARDRDWWALPGVFAARGLDAGSAELLAALAEPAGAGLAGAEVLDLGCGTGVLSGAALEAGAVRVCALDDDLAAVRSCRRNLPSDAAQVLHSDLDAALEPERRFDVVVANPPFHVGKTVRLALSRAFVEAAHRRLRPGGALLMVANRALPYERQLGRWHGFETVRESAAFKVLRARR